MKLTTKVLNLIADRVEKIASQDLNATIQVTGGIQTDEGGIVFDYTGDNLSLKDRPHEQMGFACHLKCVQVTAEYIEFEGPK